MMLLEPGVLTTLALAAVSGIAWAVKVQGRVNAHDSILAEREKLAAERYTALNDRLDRIESMLDNLTPPRRRK